MALDDPIVWILIAAVVIFLFGAGKIPQFARAFGQARREFKDALSGTTMAPNITDNSDPLVAAAQKEGIDTAGKTREQIASEISWKISKK